MKPSAAPLILSILAAPLLISAQAQTTTEAAASDTTPATSTEPSAASSPLDQPAPSLPASSSIADILNGDKRFSTLIALIQTAELESTLANELPLTIFAPSNDAFAALGQEKIDQLLDPANRQELKTLLLRHIVAGNHSAESLQQPPASPLTTLANTELSLGSSNGHLSVNGLEITETNLGAADGVIFPLSQPLPTVPGQGPADPANPANATATSDPAAADTSASSATPSAIEASNATPATSSESPSPASN